MAHYLFQGSYTSESWATQIKDPGNVVERIEPILSACKATLQCAYYAFGATDIVLIIDFPTPEDAATFSLTVAAGGSLRSATLTPLLTVDQGMSVLKKAQKAGMKYRPPVTLNLTDTTATPAGARR